jgi:hypothetical protein
LKTNKSIILVLMFLFAATGLAFLLIPDKVLTLFNNLSSFLNMAQSPLTGVNFFLILAVGYMYLVTILALLAFKHPDNKYFYLLLAHAKLASSVLSLAFFLWHDHYLIYLANFLIDGVIGTIVLILYLRMRRIGWAHS